MITHNANNIRIKHKYLSFLKEAKGLDEATVDAVAKALTRFDGYNKHRDYKQFHIEQAKGFKAHLGKQVNERTGKPLSAATLHATAKALTTFFEWLAMQPGYKSKLQFSDAQYFNMSGNEVRVAAARREPRVPTIEQILHVLRSMPAQSDVEKRDRALIAFTLLTGARDSATISFRLVNIDTAAGRVEHDARNVNAKRGKTFTIHFFPVPEEVRQIVVEWVDFLRTDKLWGGDDPLFPATQMGIGANLQLAVMGLRREPWATTAPVRKIFRQAFEAAGLPYANPHSFRNTLVQYSYKLKLDYEEGKAWSLNLGHDHVDTTYSAYGSLTPYRQAEIMRGLGMPGATKPNEESFNAAIELLQRAQRGG